MSYCYWGLNLNTSSAASAHNIKIRHYDRSERACSWMEDSSNKPLSDQSQQDKGNSYAGRYRPKRPWVCKETQTRNVNHEYSCVEGRINHQLKQMWSRNPNDIEMCWRKVHSVWMLSNTMLLSHSAKNLYTEWKILLVGLDECVFAGRRDYVTVTLGCH